VGTTQNWIKIIKFGRVGVEGIIQLWTGSSGYKNSWGRFGRLEVLRRGWGSWEEL
jgi:hypothetical protein